MIEIKESHNLSYNHDLLRFSPILRRWARNDIKTYLVIHDGKRVDSFLNLENAQKCVERLKLKKIAQATSHSGEVTIYIPLDYYIS